MADLNIQASSYEDGSIVTLEGLAVYRESPSQVIPDTEHLGISQLLIEVLDNSCDEALLKGDAGQVDVMVCPDPKRKTVQMIVADNGRGIPFGDMWRAMTQPNSSGKFGFSNGSYIYSSGQFGIGGKVTAALSEHYRAISYRGKEGFAQIYINKGQHEPQDVWNKTSVFRRRKVDRTGVLTIIEPDGDILSGIDTYCPDGWLTLIDRMRKYAFFHPNTNLKFYQSSKALPSNIWSADVDVVDDILKDVINSSTVVFNSREFNRESWVNSYLGVRKPFAWSYDFSKSANPPNDSLYYDISIKYHDTESAGAKLGMMNSVPIDHGASNHISELMVVLKSVLSEKIADKQIRTFFNDIYRLPIYITVNAKFKGVKFTGATKDKFFSQVFREAYGGHLLHHFRKTKEGSEAISELIELLTPDITEKYLASINGASVVKAESRLFKDLAHPTKFANCSAKDRSEATLFIVEGDSAGRGVASIRDGETMGIYYMKGKSINGLSKWGPDQISREVRKKQHGTYHDILKIFKLDPDNPNLDSLYFNKLVIMTDADSHGKHIASIITGNMYALCPQFVEAGKMYVVTPPYYKLNYKKGAKDKSHYIRSYEDLVLWFCENVYRPTFNIKLGQVHPNPNDLSKRKETVSDLDQHPEVFDAFMMNILKYGEMLTNLSQELMINALILEKLTYISYYLDRETVEPEAIRQILCADSVQYDDVGHILTLIYGRDDHVIPLFKVKERLTDELLPLLNRMKWKDLRLYITAKRYPGLRNQLMSMGEFYSMLKDLESDFTIEKLKGLGTMEPEECYQTCMDPRYRTMYQITSVSDVDLIWDLLGKNSDKRKNLLVDQTVAR